MSYVSRFLFAIDPRNFSSGLWRSTGWLTAANFVVVALALVRLPVLTRILTKDEVGMLALVAAMMPFAQLLSMSGLEGAAYHYMAKGHAAAYRTAVRIRFKWSVLAAAGLLACAVYWAFRDNSLLAWLFTLAAVTFPLTSGLSSDYVFTSQERFRELFWYRVGIATTSYVGFVVLILMPLMSQRVVWFSAANRFALAALQVGVFVWVVREMRRAGIAEMASQDRTEMVRYGKHLTAISGISTVQSRVDAILVGWLLPLSVMADYSIAQLVFDQFKRLWLMYYTVRYPPLVRMPPDRQRRRIVLESVVGTLGFALLGIVAGVALWFLIPVILPVEYSSSRPLVLCLLGAFVAGLPGMFAEMYFRTQQDERSQYIMRGVGAVCGIVFPVVFLLYWQALGVALGRLIAGAIVSVVGAVLFARGGVHGSRLRHTEGETG